uniref:Putative secreted protein n=1 Tax=Anopheles triannulatus TaxID=58253 RepID=A0A2M4B1W0_9DIPT
MLALTIIIFCLFFQQFSTWTRASGRREDVVLARVRTHARTHFHIHTRLYLHMRSPSANLPKQLIMLVIDRLCVLQNSMCTYRQNENQQMRI